MAESGTLGKEWQMVTENSKERLQYLYTSGEYSDLDIVFPKDEVTFKTHRLILSMSSPVFGVMLMGPLAAGKELTLPQDSPSTFRKLLDHMYLDQMDLESNDEALEVYALTHKYKMESARKACVQYFLCNLKEEMALAVLKTSVVYEDEVLNKKCKEVLNRNPDAIMLPGTVSYLSKQILMDILKENTMTFSSEVVPFKGLIAWGKGQLDHQEKEEPSGSALREKVEDLLKEVRFLAMSCDEFVDNVVDTNVLSHTECIHIQRAIRGADPSTVPEATPLNPTREGRRPNLREIDELSSCDLGQPDIRNEESIFSCGGKMRNIRKQPIPSFTFGMEMSSSLCAGLIENLSSSRNIYVYYLEAPTGGTISIVDDKGRAVDSITSEDRLFTFKRPVALKKDKQYGLVLFPEKSFVIDKVVAGSKTVGGVILSYSRGCKCKLYFSE